MININIAVYKKILSTVFLFVLLAISGLFVFAKDASAQTLAVSPTDISCDTNPITFTLAGLDEGRWRVRLWENEDNRPVVKIFIIPDGLSEYEFTEIFNVDGECAPGIEIASGSYQARLHKDLDETDGEDWDRKDTIAGITVGTGGTDPVDPGTGSPAPLWYDQSYSEWQAKVYARGNEQEIFGERYTAAQVQWVIYALVYNIMNMSGDGGLFTCVSDPANSGNIDGICGGVAEDAFGRFDPGGDGSAGYSSVLDTMFEPRAISFVGYVRGVGARVTNFIPEANAQETGFGFTAFNPVQKLWRQVRNATYLLLVIVIIVMAFMIMFRTKINPQTVISVQSALPKIIIALILITFSYAIAGLMVDLMYVVIGIIAAIFTAGGEISSMPWVEFFGKMTNDNSAILLYLQYWLWAILTLIMVGPGALGIGAGLVSLATPAGGIIGGFLLIIVVVFMIFLIIVGVKVLWLLVKTYVTILLLVIFGPIQILAGTVMPKAGFGSWLKNILANLAVYPVVSTLFIIAFVFLSGAEGFVVDLLGLDSGYLPFEVGGAIDGAGTWRPPLTGGAAGVDSLLWLGASFGVIMMIPSAGNMIKAAIQGREFDYGSAFGQSLRTAGIMGMMGGTGRDWVAGRGSEWLAKNWAGEGGLRGMLGRGGASYGEKNRYIHKTPATPKKPATWRRTGA